MQVDSWLAYSRVSRVGDRTETLISPTLQLQRIEGFAAARGLRVEALEPELDVSGGKVERPILGEAIRRIEAGEVAGIIVAQLDRLSRMDIADALRTIRRIEDAGGEVIAVAENFDASTPEGRLARNMFLSIGQLQLDRYTDQFAAAKRQAVNRGIWPTNTAPIGYRVGPERGLVVVEADAERVRRAFEARAAGESWATVGRPLDRGGSGARKVITNRVYLGEVRLRVQGVDVVCEDAHEAIVDRATWEAAQIQHPAPQRRGNPPALLTGLIRCAGCRGAMSRSGSKGEWFYRCSNRQAGGRCPAPAIISCRLVDPYVEALALQAIEGLHVRGHARAGTEEAEAALERAEAELATFQDAVSAVDLGAEAVGHGLRRRAEEVATARRKLGETRSAALPAIEGASIRDLWPALSIEERRHVLRGALGVVWVAKGRGLGRVRVIGAGDEPADLPRAGRRGEFRPAPDGDLPGEIRPPAA